MNKIKRDKVAGAVYGFAIGDAMGATTEFMSDKQIKSTFGEVTDIIGGGWLGLKAGEVTDDTQMTLCVMDALMAKPISVSEFQEGCAQRFANWMLYDNPKDIGNCCARGIQHYVATGKAIPRDDTLLGNGSLMRAMPCALLDNKMFNLAQSRLTHNNPMVDKAIAVYHSNVVSLMASTPATMVNVSAGLVDPDGHVYNTLNNALYWASEGTFEEAIVGAVNHGGDADTIAAIAGSLAGARFGFDAIPRRWMDQLDRVTKLQLKKFIFFVFSCLQI